MINILINQDKCNCGCFTFQDISSPEDLAQLCNCDDGEQWRIGVTKTDFVLTTPSGKSYKFDKGYLPGSGTVTVCSDDLVEEVTVVSPCGDVPTCGCGCEETEIVEKKCAALEDGCYNLEYRQWGLQSVETLFQDYYASFKSSKLATQKLWVEKNGVWEQVTGVTTGNIIVFSITATKDIYTKAQLRAGDHVDFEQYLIGYNDYLEYVASAEEVVIASKSQKFSLWCNTYTKLADAIKKINLDEDCIDCTKSKDRNFDLMNGWVQLEAMIENGEDCSCSKSFIKYIEQITKCE